MRSVERGTGGHFRVDMMVEVAAPRGDSLSETADYRVLFSQAKNLVERRRFRTLEALACAIARSAARVPKVRGVRVKVTKINCPLGHGATSAVEVELP